MANVFISYRSSEGFGHFRAWLRKLRPADRRGDTTWALAIHERLQGGGVDAYLDVMHKSAGMSISNEIPEELAKCRVLLMVVGAEWVAPRNLKRLHKEDDWVRVELCRALKRQPDILLIPTCVDGTRWPQKLPDTLLPLQTLKSAVLSHVNFASDFSTLFAQIRQWLGTPPAASKDELPKLLPLLCDRTPQENTLASLVRDLPNSRNPIFVLQGHKFEGHGAFIDRLKYMNTFVELFSAQSSGVTVVPVEWTLKDATKGDYAAVLRTAIKRGGLLNRDANDENISKFLRRPMKPYVFTIEVVWSEYLAFRSSLLEGFSRAWRELFAWAGASGGSSTTVAPWPLVLWINLLCEDDAQDADVSSVGSALPNLESFGEGDIARWARLPLVAPYIAGFEEKILSIHKDPRWADPQGRVRMFRFAEAVREILRARSKGEADA